MPYDYRTNHWRTRARVRTHVAPHSRDIRETLARCSPDARRATVARISCNSRTIVLREMINQEK